MYKKCEHTGKVDSTAERSTKLVVSGVFLTDGSGRIVDSAGDTSLPHFSGFNLTLAISCYVDRFLRGGLTNFVDLAPQLSILRD